MDFQLNSTGSSLHGIECCFHSEEQAIDVTMRCTAEIVGELPFESISSTEQCKDDCIPPSDQSYHSTLLTGEH